ncbi:MAG: PhnA domain-containing protein [Flavobacteriaceae bacterium]
MSMIQMLKERSNDQCELCQSSEEVSLYRIPPSLTESVDTCLMLCSTCRDQIEEKQDMDSNHWRCLNDSMWSEHSAVQVMSWRMLQRIKSLGWPQDLLDMMYLEPEVEKFAAATGEADDPSEKIIHKDSNGVLLANGDNVVLIKDLNVKGGGFTAKRGTAVRRISLVHDNADQIEGKVDGQHIVILNKFVKKL